MQSDFGIDSSANGFSRNDMVKWTVLIKGFIFKGFAFIENGDNVRCFANRDRVFPTVIGVKAFNQERELLNQA